MNTNELPSFKHLRSQMVGLGAIIRINRILRCIGLGSKKISALQTQYNERRRRLTELTEYPRKFNKIFSGDGWLAHESMNFEVMKKAVDDYESGRAEAAEQTLLNYYGAEQVEKRMFFFLGLEELRVRRKFIDYALAEYKAGRYYSTVPLLLMIIDGAVNDATGKGFHTSGVDMDVWDCLTTSDGAIYTIRDIFKKGRRTTCTDTISLPYRHGILHGMDLGYDNPTVAAKCWCFLFVVRDWLVSKKSEPQRKIAFVKETRAPSVRELIDTIARTNRLKEAFEAWRPRVISQDYIADLNNSLFADERLPEGVVLAFMSFWKRRNYGDMAKLFRTQVIGNPKTYAKSVRKQYGTARVDAYSIINIVDVAPVITHVIVRATSSGESGVSFWEFRMISEDDNGDVIPLTIPGGRWQIVWLQQKNEHESEQGAQADRPQSCPLT